MMSDYITREQVIDVLKETGIIQDNDLGHLVVDEINRIPTVDEKEIVRNVFERIVKRLEETKMRYFLSIANTKSKILDFAYENVGDALDESIKIAKEECGINE